MSAGLALGGFAVGVLVGLTGMGGGSLTTPFLILVAGVRPVIAVGTDLAYSAATKWLGAAAHWRQGTVDLRVVRRLAVGSVPGSLAGVAVLRLLGPHGQAADTLITRVLGVTLILVAASLFLGRSIRAARRPRPAAMDRHKPQLTVALGLVVGFLLGITSVGSGTLIMAVLLLVTRRRPSSQLVGIDVFHGAVLVTAAAAGHLSIGTIDWGITASLLAGSLPGVLIGSRLAPRVPERFLRPALAAVLLTAGARLI